MAGAGWRRLSQNALEGAMDLPTIMIGFAVGAAVGLTGVGGGALMTPILVLALGVPPVTAIGTDLWYSAVTKTIGGIAHHRQGTVDWQVLWRLSAGSIPAAVATLIWINRSHVAARDPALLVHALGAVLLAGAAAMLLRGRVRSLALGLGTRGAARVTRLQPPLTVLAGAIMGALVALTSVGAGALGTAMLLYLHPHRLSSSRLAGTGLAHAVPLALIAGSGHLLLGDVRWTLLVSLLLGSVPGVMLGARFSTRSPEGLLRAGLTVILIGVAARLLMSISMSKCPELATTGTLRPDFTPAESECQSREARCEQPETGGLGCRDRRARYRQIRNGDVVVRERERADIGA